MRGGSVPKLQCVGMVRVLLIGEVGFPVPVLAGAPTVADPDLALRFGAKESRLEDQPVDVRAEEFAASLDVRAHVLAVGLNVLDHLRTRWKGEGDLDGGC